MLQRLKDIRKTLHFSQSSFAKYLGITQTAYSMIENGNRPLSEKYIKIICLTFNVSEEWLVNGLGEMFLSSPYEEEFIRIFSHLIPETQEYLLLMAKELLTTQNKLLDYNTITKKESSD
ncbi:MAG: helix-turn-helix domain-containing protein [Clostridium sp.]|nr:helix-turn-helix domain-containing protein [Clostridium sp.]